MHNESSLHRYGAPWGTRVRWITLGVLVLVLVISIVIPSLTPQPGRQAVGWSVPMILFVVLGVTALFHIRGFELKGTELWVRRSLWITRLSLEGLQSMEADPLALKGAWKQIGSDGYFGIYGTFRSRRLGKFSAFVTDPARSVILRWADRTVVVSPDSPDRFLRDLRTSVSGFRTP